MVNISLWNLLQAILYCLIFIAAITFSNIFIEYRKLSNRNFTKDQGPKIKIVIISILVLSLIMTTYTNHCIDKNIGFLQCIYIDPQEENLGKNIAIALFINTTLFLGGLHQELYNGQIKRKLLKFYKKQFQWDLFKKLFVVPVCVQIVYRALICRIIDPNLNHPSFFVFFSASLFAISHFVNVFKFGEKHDLELSLKSAGCFLLYSLGIQVIYNFIFGLYICHIFSKSHTLISSIVIQVYANFMGYPEYFQILKGNIQNDRVKSDYFLIIRISNILLIWCSGLSKLLLVIVIFVSIKTKN